MVNAYWQLSSDAVEDFYPPHSGLLEFDDGQTNSSFILSVKPDGILEGEERCVEFSPFLTLNHR